MLSGAQAVFSVCVNQTRVRQYRSCSNPAVWSPRHFGLTRSQPMFRFLLHASQRGYSNLKLPKVFRNASLNATFPQTDHSRESDAATNASASLIDLTNSTAAAT